MTKDEKKFIQGIREQLAAIQAEAPDKTTYENGRTQGSLSSRLMGILQQLDEVLNDEPVATK